MSMTAPSDPPPQDSAKQESAKQESAKQESARAVSVAERILRLIPVWLRMVRRMVSQPLPPDEAHEVRTVVEAEGRFTERYALMCALSAGIATLGLLQSSAAVVIGAMLVSPLMSPIAALGFGFASLDGRRIQEAARVVAIGAIVGIGLGMLLTWLSPIRNATPEIIARTAPTLLDLAVALLSGIAGGYATVHRRGETAIGVAIATALMPPLATLGYSLAVLRFDFAAGAGLLFLTNLAAIAFCFALVARLRGVARPLTKVEFKPVHVILGIMAFLALAAPLALTLRRVTLEANASATARREVAAYFAVEPRDVVQLFVTWHNLRSPEIEAQVVVPEYKPGAEEALRGILAGTLRTQPQFDLQQIQAADPQAQAEALIDAALRAQRRTPAQAALSPPVHAVRTASLLPIEAVWSDGDQNAIYLVAAPLEGVDLGAYRREEARLDALFSAWRVMIVPPFKQRIFLPFPAQGGAPDYAARDEAALAIWALSRWNVQQIGLEGLAGQRATSQGAQDLALARVAAILPLFAEAGLSVTPLVADRAVSEALFSEGGQARVMGVDVVARPGVSPPPGRTPSSTPW